MQSDTPQTTDWWCVCLGSDRVLHVTSGYLTTAQSVDDLIKAVRSLAPMLPELDAPERDWILTPYGYDGPLKLQGCADAKPSD